MLIVAYIFVVCGRSLLNKTNDYRQILEMLVPYGEFIVGTLVLFSSASAKEYLFGVMWTCIFVYIILTIKIIVC